MTPAASPKRPRARFLIEAVRFAVSAIQAHKTRSLLTGLSMVIGNASVIVVVSVALTGRDFVIRQIQGVGSNLIYAYYEAGGNVSESEADYITLADVEAVRTQLGNLAQGTAGVMGTWDRVFLDGRSLQIRVLGSNDEYRVVRNLEIPTGRFFDEVDLEQRAKVCLLTVPLAEKLFGSPRAAIGKSVQVHGLPFTVIGVFREGVETLGQTEVAADSVLIPITVMQYFRSRERIDPLYVSVRSQEEVDTATALIEQILVSRHRPGSRYRVENLSSILTAAENIAAAMTVVLILVAAVTLTVSGIFIMNIMLISVSERTKEIGVRMSVGATRRQIHAQFLVEAICISALGGLAGVGVGVSIPLLARSVLPQLALPAVVSEALAQLDIVISPLSVLAAVLVSLTVGAIFGLLPASRAAKLNPVEALRYE